MGLVTILMPIDPLSNTLAQRVSRWKSSPSASRSSGGTYERGKDKAQFLDHLSKISSADAAAYTVKLTSETIGAIRLFVN